MKLCINLDKSSDLSWIIISNNGPYILMEEFNQNYNQSPILPTVITFLKNIIKIINATNLVS